MSKKKMRRSLKRIAERKGIPYSEAIKRHLGVGSLKSVDKNLIYSLYKNQ